ERGKKWELKAIAPDSADTLPRACRGCHRTRLRKINRERRTGARHAVDADQSAALLHEAVHRRDAKLSAAGKIAARTRADERLEQLGSRLIVEAGTGVAHRELDVAAGRGARMRGDERVVHRAVRRLDGYLSAVRHRVARVDGERQDDVIELRRI